MRNRKDIESEVSSSWVDESGELQFSNADEVEMQELVLEVLLDIRDFMLKNEGSVSLSRRKSTDLLSGADLTPI